MKTLQESILNKTKAKQTSTKKHIYYERYVNSGKFDKYQLKQIKEGFDNGLKLEHIELYAKPELDWTWMGAAVYVLYGAYDRKLSDKDIKALLNPKFDYDQISAINSAVSKKISNEQLMFCANPKFSKDLMWTYILEFEYGISIKRVKPFDLTKFNPHTQLKPIIWGIRIDLPAQEIKKYAKPQYDADKMFSMLRELAKENGIEDRLPEKNDGHFLLKI